MFNLKYLRNGFYINIAAEKAVKAVRAKPADVPPEVTPTGSPDRGT